MNGGLGANARVATRGRWPGLFSAAIALSLFASGCGDSDATGSSTKDDTVADADGVAGDVAPDTSIPDSIVFDTLVDTASDGTGGGDADTSDPNRCLENPGAFLCPCVANDDCNSNFCVPSASGDQVCTVVCEEQCPAGLDCKAVFFPGQDPTFLCVDVRANLCRPCRRNTDCQGNFGQIGDRCVSQGAAEGAFCGVTCDDSRPCPEGYDCEEVQDVEVGSTSRQCVPTSGTCECSVRAVIEEASTSCLNGGCSGSRVCREEGLTTCDAPAPVTEACNGLDDNCNGATDETFPNTDGDALADCVDDDDDDDGILDVDDNCPLVPNHDQEDADEDGVGDVCDVPLTPVVTGTTPPSPANDNAPVFYGTGEPGSTVALHTSSSCGGDAVATAVVGEDGTWEVAVPVDDDTTTVLWALAVDADSGLPSPCSAAGATYVEDSTAPLPPNLTGTNPPSPGRVVAYEVLAVAEAGATVTLFTDAACGSPADLSGVAGSDGRVAIASLVVDGGTAEFWATATDAAGNVSECVGPVTYRHDAVAPAAPTLTTTIPTSPSDTVTTPILVGQAEGGSTVTIYTTADCTGAVTTTVNVAQNGIFTVIVTVAANSSTTFYATATDAAGNVSACSPDGINYIHDDDNPDPPVLTGTDPPSPGATTSPTVLGETEPGATVRIYLGEGCTSFLVGTTTAGADGTFSVVVPVAANADTFLYARATDLAGRTSDCTADPLVYHHDGVAPAAPVVLSTAPASPSSEPSPVVVGTAEPGSSVQVYRDATCDTPLGAPATTEANGSYGAQVPADPNATTTFWAQATDAAGNVSPCSSTSATYTHDDVAPGAPVITSTSPESPASSLTPAVNGDAEAGANVVIYGDDACAGVSLGAGAADGDGHFAVSVTVPANASTTLYAQATDAAGNAGPCSVSPVLYTHDDSQPIVPQILASEPASPSAASTTPTLTGEAEAETTVTIYKTAGCSGSPVATTTATATGTFSVGVTVAANSTTTFYARSRDSAGNDSPCSPQGLTYVHDDVAPGAPVWTGTTPSSPSNAVLTPLLRGDAEAASEIAVYTTSDCSGTPVAGATADGAGHFGAIATATANATTTFYAKATDAAGNTGPCSLSGLSYTHDDQAPAPPTLESTNPPSPASTTTPGVLGHGETGATIRFYATADCTGSVIGQGVVVAAGGAFELTVGVGGDTVTAIRATATDAAGNVSTCSAPLSYTNDNTAPAKPVWVGSTPASPNRTSTTPTLTGTTDPGVSVRIYKGSGCGGAALATVTSDGSGQFTYAATVSANSTTRFYAVAVDQVGNASACSDALTYVHDSQGPPKPTITSSVPTSPGQDATPDLLGSAESQATVKVYRTSDCTGTVVGTDTADGAMSWRTNGVAVGANNGATQFYASATDAVGNVSPCSDAFTYVHDDIAPARPIVVDTDPVGPANEQNPAVRGTAEAGSTVQIYANATCTGAARGAGTASGSGAFSIASLADQNTTTTFYARATDAAGNVSPCSTTFASYVHDGSAPNRPVMIRTEPDRWSSTVHAPLVVGTAEPLSTVRVYLTQGCSGAFQTTTAAANGEFSLVDDIGTNDKEVKFAAKAVDSSGNVSPCSQNNLPYRYDKTPPTFAGAAGMVLGANTTSSARVSWTAASDNFTTAANMVYLVCLSERCGAVDCDFDDPAATNISTTAAGATLYDFTGLTANTRYYVVVRARDEVGNKDANQAIVSVKTEGLNAVVGVTVGENVACATLADGSRSCWGASTIPNDIVDPVQFSISPDHGCAVRRTGQVRCWGGENGHGEHGSGATGYSGSGSVAVLTLTNAVKVGAGQEHTCALTADGAVYCWGRDDRGQVGNGSSSAANQLAPVPVMTDFNGTTPLTGAIDIAVGESFACALRIDGAVWCWGEGVYGQLGTGQQQNVTFAQQGQATNALSIVAGKRHTCALNAAGRVSCWGSNDYGQVGIGLAQSVVTTPQDVGLADVLALGTGALHVCAVRANGQASCWGRNDHAQIGTGTASENVPTPTPVAGLSALSAIAAGDGFTCARRADGTAWCWGSGEGGRLGQGTSQADSATPVQAVLPLGVAAVTDLSIDHEHACVSLSDGTARCWGRATDGQLGDGESGEDRLPLVVVSGLGGVLDVATGGRHSCARTATGAPYCWGANDRGQLGAGTGASAVPRPVSTLTAVRQLALGYEHTCALKADGTVACWGDNGLGQVGTAAGGTKTTPTAVPGLTQVTSIAAGKNHACASTTAGTVYCWGANGAGQVNAGTGTPSGPTQVPGITTARAVSAGGAHSCALLVDGTARCWGQNTSGQIGGGSVGGNLGVTTVTGLSGVRTIAAGDRHTCAVRFTGVISCWGDNTAGSVGTGAAQTTYGTATALTGLPAARGVSAGEDNTCAPTSTGLAYCWGDNDAGALGTSAPSTTDSRVPVLVECLP